MIVFFKSFWSLMSLSFIRSVVFLGRATWEFILVCLSVLKLNFPVTSDSRAHLLLHFAFSLSGPRRMSPAVG